MKPLLPTLKERKRYILIKIQNGQGETRKGDIVEAVAKAGLLFIGELGMAKAGMQFLPETYDPKTKTGVVRVNHKFVDETKASLALVKEISGKKATITSMKTSGIITKLR